VTRVDLFSDPLAYSGFFTTDSATNTNMFYLFIEAANGDKNAPVILWLQGGPGGSSLFGLFSELGPFQLSNDPLPTHMIPRPGSWGESYATLYIDNPVGTGFSYTTSPAAYSHNEEEVATNLYEALRQFYTVHAEYQPNGFYIAGESYAGKYIPATAARIDLENTKGSTPIVPLKGVLIGDGLSDPETQIAVYDIVLHEFGMVGQLEAQVIHDFQQKCIGMIKKKQWVDAGNCFADLINGPPDLVQNITQTDNYYDIRRTDEPDYGPDFAEFANRTDIRAALHVGNHYFQADDRVYRALLGDIAQSVKHYFTPLLNKGYKVLLYGGQYDLIVAPRTTEAMIPSIPWDGIPVFLKQPQKIWRVDPSDNEIAGYVRQYKNFAFIVVRLAGHILPFDQLRASRDMVVRFIEGKPFA